MNSITQKRKLDTAIFRALVSTIKWNWNWLAGKSISCFNVLFYKRQYARRVVHNAYPICASIILRIKNHKTKDWPPVFVVARRLYISFSSLWQHFLLPSPSRNHAILKSHPMQNSELQIKAGDSGVLIRRGQARLLSQIGILSSKWTFKKTHLRSNSSGARAPDLCSQMSFLIPTNVVNETSGVY